MSKLNGNTKNIRLSWNADASSIAFLDLEIFKQGCSFKTRNFFKPTDRNGYIPLDSCHHHTWLYNIPRGQFIRLDLNYHSQANVLAEMFFQKVYTREHIVEEIVNAGNMYRTTLVADTDRSNKRRDNFEYRIILDFNIQHKKFEKIILRHWDILKKDNILGSVLPARPKFIYRRPPTLRDMLAPSVVDPPVIKENRIFSFMSGFYACGKCPACEQCKHNLKKRKEFIASATKRTYQIKTESHVILWGWYICCNAIADSNMWGELLDPWGSA